MTDKSLSTNVLEKPSVVSFRATEAVLHRLGSWKRPLVVFALWRLGLGLVALLADRFLPQLTPVDFFYYRPPSANVLEHKLLGVWSAWDGQWFLQIAEVGYAPPGQSTPFYPLYPALVRLLAFFLGGNDLWAGVILSLLCAALCFVLLHELVRREWDTRLADRAVLYLAAFPTSFFLVACYSESLFLALTLGAFLALRHGRHYLLGGVLVGAAALTRNLGLLLLLPLGWELLKGLNLRGSAVEAQQGLASASASTANTRLRFSFNFNTSTATAFALFLAPALVLAAIWPLFSLRVFGSLLSSTGVLQEFWHRSLNWPFVTIAWAVGKVAGPTGNALIDYTNRQNLLFWLLAMALLVGLGVLVARRQLPLSYFLFSAIAVVVPLCWPVGDWPLVSFPRYMLVAFPFFIGLALAGRRAGWLHRAYLWIAFPLLAWEMANFATWWWVA